MKYFYHFLLIFLLGACSVNAQQEKGIKGSTSWLNNWTEFRPNKKDYGEANQILAGSITENTKLYKKNVYLLQGDVYVANNATLTIEPGTVILADSDSAAALIITKGATIIADGLETDPIVFTSNKAKKKAGDWGGLIILGDAPTNKFGNVSSVNYDLDNFLSSYGGNNANANSGILRYVRIEFAGNKLKDSGNYNALLLAGVGNKTILDNIMVSYALGNGFEIYGGDVILSKLVSFKTNAVDYRFNYGAQSKIDNSLAIRNSYVSSNTGSKCLSVVSYDSKSEVDLSKKQTNVTATNLTFVNDSEQLSQDIAKGLVKEAVYVGENAALDFKRGVISGFSPAVILDDKIEINGQNLNNIKFQDMYFNFCKGNIFTKNNPNNEDLESWYGNIIFFNVYSQSDNLETFVDFSNEKRPDFRLRLGKITASNNQ
ncbi:hypothetical protein [Flavobacterium muglaense]|uniref:T9SS C-terminal target domain-containing protein n=1 Tax=Flavobacterium muglaense TaxID=2764716 RepID=A0A923SGE8_9FLAO|nr:hypothetical protein [Flavobacterium muglaense]MBC5838996.1 hypothetical protein [Flavobacterium muglaense]MBC5845500.1 hypothetical protein [Flavobacterium muglaense]